MLDKNIVDNKVLQMNLTKSEGRTRCSPITAPGWRSYAP